MILYKTIKYIILDQCLEKLFSAMKRSLNVGEHKEITNMDELYEGMYFNRLEYLYQTYYDCTINEIEKATEYHIVITIDYKKYEDTSTGLTNGPGRGVFLFTDTSIPGWGTETYLYR